MSTLTVATIKSNTSGPPVFQNTSGAEIGTLCRAWVNFNGTGVVAIRAQYNVSSITDNATGNYTVNFTTALVDANYVVNCESAPDDASVAAGAWMVGVFSASGTGPLSKTSTQVRIRTSDLSGVARDYFNGGVSIFR